MFLNLPKTLLKLFSWPKFDEGCWNYRMIPVHSRAESILPSRAKKNGKIVSDYFAVLAIILPLIWLLDTTSLTCEISCILYPNFEHFCPNNGQFFNVGDATASPASPCRMLMVRRNFARILPDLPEKTPKKLFMSIQAPLFSNQSRLAPFLLIFSGVCEGSQRFFPGFIGIGPDFMGFCPDFHQIKIFGVWPHASYTSDEE